MLSKVRVVGLGVSKKDLDLEKNERVRKAFITIYHIQKEHLRNLLKDSDSSSPLST